METFLIAVAASLSFVLALTASRFTLRMVLRTMSTRH
jgi:hypothetical protein